MRIFPFNPLKLLLYSLIIRLAIPIVYAQKADIQQEFQKILKKKKASNSLSRFIEKYRNLGYAEFNVDTSSQPYSLRVGRLYILNRYQNNVNFLPKNSPLKIHKPFSWKSLNELHQKILSHYGNLGYPMVKILPKIEYNEKDDTLWVDIQEEVQPNKLFTIDSIIIPKGIREKPSFVYKIIDLYPGEKFQQEKIEKIARNLKRSEYYHNVQPPKLQFSDSTAKILLNFERLKSNRLDLLVGLLPPQNSTQKLQFTVTADFAMVSMFKQGEMFRMKYEKLQNLSQKVQIQYLHPYLFQLPVKLSFQFELFKQDTSFLNRNLNVGGSYLLNRESEILFSYQQRNSNLLSVARYQNVTWPPPPQLDSRSTTYALGYQFKQLNNPWNPSKGVLLYFTGSTGIKKILKVRGLENLDYDRIGRIQPRQELEVKFFRYTPVGKRSTAVLGLQSYFLNQKNYFENDLKPIGGYKILRGFNENQFWARLYAVLTVEYRLLLEEFSYIGVFTDLGYLEQRKWEETQIYKPIGIGVALNFYTNIGIMSVSYAIGKYENSNFQPTRGRVHIGIVNNF